MTKDYPILETIFSSCPICKKGAVQKIKKSGKLTSTTEILCNNCNAKFIEKDIKKYPERCFQLDLSKSDYTSPYDKELLRESEWKRGIPDIDYCIKTNALPIANIVGLNIILEPNEVTHWYDNAKLMEERAVRDTYGGAFRVTKGVYVGGHRGQSHGELKTIDVGSILLTNKRLVFNGRLKNIIYDLNKIISVEQYKDAVEIGSSTKKKVQVFIVDDPKKLAAYLKIAIKNYGQTPAIATTDVVIEDEEESMSINEEKYSPPQINSFDVTSKINFLECLRNEDILAQEEFEVLYERIINKYSIEDKSKHQTQSKAPVQEHKLEKETNELGIATESNYQEDAGHYTGSEESENRFCRECGNKISLIKEGMYNNSYVKVYRCTECKKVFYKKEGP